MDFEVVDLGIIAFSRAWQFQKEVWKAVRNNQIYGALIICQHYPVITLGRLANKNNILISRSELHSRKIPTYEIERGGDVTYHGPGQIVAYPIFNLDYFGKDIHNFLRKLEEVIIGLLWDFAVFGRRYRGLTGVWIEKSKIASIGIAIKNWITYHGLSINIKNDDLVNFGLIRPCGMEINLTSLESVLGHDIKMDEVKFSLINKFKEIFSKRLLNNPALIS